MRWCENLVDIGESFFKKQILIPTNSWLQKSASIQPRTSHLIFIILAASRDLIFTERSSPSVLDGLLLSELSRESAQDNQDSKNLKSGLPSRSLAGLPQNSAFSRADMSLRRQEVGVSYRNVQKNCGQFRSAYLT